jgi:galactose mutarotase-like enzyme
MLTSMSDAAAVRYAVLETRDLVETHRLLDQQADAEVVVAPSRGGMVTDFRIGGDQILFLDRATLRDHSQNVRGGVPILFPVAGRLTDDAFSLEGERIAMPQHGFARRMAWHVTATDTADGASLWMTLDSNDATLALWPFRFRATFQYRLREGALTILQRFENRSDRPMPIHPGLHPYFLLESGLKPLARVATNGTRARDTRTGVTGPLTGPIDLAACEVDLQILDQRQGITVFHRPGRPSLTLTFDAAQPVVTVWTLPGRDFVCIEPWARPSDAINRADAILVAPGDAYEATFGIEQSPVATGAPNH